MHSQNKSSQQETDACEPQAPAQPPQTPALLSVSMEPSKAHGSNTRRSLRIAAQDRKLVMPRRLDVSLQPALDESRLPSNYQALPEGEAGEAPTTVHSVQAHDQHSPCNILGRENQIDLLKRKIRENQEEEKITQAVNLSRLTISDEPSLNVTPVMVTERKQDKKLCTLAEVFLDDIGQATSQEVREQVRDKYRSLIRKRVLERAHWNDSELRNFNYAMKRLQVNEKFFARVLDCISWDRESVTDKIALIPFSQMNCNDLKRLGVEVATTAIHHIIDAVEANDLPKAYDFLERGKIPLEALSQRVFLAIDSFTPRSEGASQTIIDTCASEVHLIIKKQHYFLVNKELYLSQLDSKSVPVEIKHQITLDDKTVAYTTFLTGVVDYAIVTTHPSIRGAGPKWVLLKDLLKEYCTAYREHSYRHFDLMLDRAGDALSESAGGNASFECDVLFIESKRRAMHSQEPPGGPPRTGGEGEEDSAILLECELQDSGESDSEDEIENILLSRSAHLSESEAGSAPQDISPSGAGPTPHWGATSDTDSKSTRRSTLKKKLSVETRRRERPLPLLTDHLAQVVGECIATHASCDREESVTKFILSTGTSWIFGVVKCAGATRICYHTEVITIAELGGVPETLRDVVFLMMTWMIVPAAQLQLLFRKPRPT